MAKKSEASKDAIPVTDENVERVGKSKQIKALVKLAERFVRIGARGPVEVGIPVFCAVEVPDKNNPEKRVYRKHSIPAGTMLEPEFVRIGKREGLIFRFKLKTEIRRQEARIEAIEMNWEDVVNAVPETVERLNDHIEDATRVVRELHNEIQRMIGTNPSMHGLLNEGFKRAQEDAVQEFKEEQLESNELFGQWG